MAKHEADVPPPNNPEAAVTEPKIEDEALKDRQKIAELRFTAGMNRAIRRATALQPAQEAKKSAGTKKRRRRRSNPNKNLDWFHLAETLSQLEADLNNNPFRLADFWADVTKNYPAQKGLLIEGSSLHPSA
jgi:hypothetical protein